MRLYIAGPITGIPNRNRPAFFVAHTSLCEAGHVAYSPHDNGLPPDSSWRDHMRADIKLMLDCDGVALLDGWDMSKGARLEEWIAHQLGMPRRSVDEWLRE